MITQQKSNNDQLMTPETFYQRENKQLLKQLRLSDLERVELKIEVKKLKHFIKMKISDVCITKYFINQFYKI